PEERRMSTETMHGNSAIVRRGYDALNTADLAALTELFDEHASWHTPGQSPLAGDADGREAVFAQFGRYSDETAGTFTADLKRVLTDEEDRVIGIHHTVAERGDKRLDIYGCIVFELVDGRIVDGREHFYDLRAWD